MYSPLEQEAHSCKSVHNLVQQKSNFSGWMYLRMPSCRIWAAKQIRKILRKYIFGAAPNPPNFQNLKQVQKGDGLPSPYLLPDDPARLVVRPAECLRPQDYSENMRSDKYEK